MAEARCRYLARDLPGAEIAARRALADARRGHFQERLPGHIELGRILSASGKTREAISGLRTHLAEIESRPGYTALGFEARLALGEVELMLGMTEGRARLRALQQEARRREFLRMSRLAGEALDRPRSTSRTARSTPIGP